tara:strand:+ start:42472 stop:42675 length:204 start_codon:yes stop_codon:yes gene_type:complete
MRNHNMYGACAYRPWDKEIETDLSPGGEPCPECLAEERGDAMRDEQKDEGSRGYDDRDDARKCGQDD